MSSSASGMRPSCRHSSRCTAHPGSGSDDRGRGGHTRRCRGRTRRPAAPAGRSRSAGRALGDLRDPVALGPAPWTDAPRAEQQAGHPALTHDIGCPAKPIFDRRRVIGRPPTTRGMSSLIAIRVSCVQSPGWASRTALSRARSFRFARRIASDMTGPRSLNDPDGSPRLRRVMFVRPSAAPSHV
jgi:hypothetical protein